MNENELFQLRIRDLVQPLAGLDLDDCDHRAFVRVADLDTTTATTATTVARLLCLARQARPLRTTRS